MLFFFSSCIIAQQQLDMSWLTVKDGLSHRNIKYATLDDRGFLWLISSGIEYYDGQKIIHFNKFDKDHYIPVSGIQTACKFQDSLLIFSSTKDLYAFNLNTHLTKKFNYPKGIPLNFNTLEKIVDFQNQDSYILVTIDDTSLTAHLVDRDWNHILSYRIKHDDFLYATLLRAYANGPADVLWLMDKYNNEILKISPQSIEKIPFAFKGTYIESNYRIVYKPGMGLLIFCNSGEVHLVDPVTNEIKLLMELDIGNDVMKSIIVDGDLIWFICLNRVISIDTKFNTFKYFNQKTFGSFNPIIHHAFSDNEHNNWICTEIGLLKIKSQPIPFVSILKQSVDSLNLQFREILPGLEPNTIITRAMQSKRDLLSISFDENMLSTKEILIPDIPGSGRIRKSDDKIYHIFNSSDILYEYDIRTMQERTFTLPHASTGDFYNHFLIRGEDDFLYQNDINGFTVFNTSTSTSKDFSFEYGDDLLSNPVRVAEIINDSLLVIGSSTSGLIIYDLKSGKLLHHYHSSSTPSLSNNFVNCLIFTSPDTIWLGTFGGGINCVALNTNKVSAYTTNDGLANNIIASIIEDDSGNFWIGTYGGLSMMNPKQQKFYNYFEEDGISDNEFNFLSTYKDTSGRLFIGTFNGMTIFRPEEVFQKRKIPQARLTGLQKYNRKYDEISHIETGLDEIGTIEVSPHDNYLQFEFAIPSFDSNSGYIFKTRLSGIDQEWQSHSYNNTIRYQKLPAGAYTLEVIGEDAIGNQSISPLKLDIQVHEIFYKTIWFMALVFACLLTLVLVFYKYRLNILRKEIETRTRISSDLHDEIGSSLTRVSLQMQLLEHQMERTKKTKVSRLSSIIDEVSAKLRDLVWSVDSRSDQWKDIIGRINDYATDTLHPKNINYTFEQKGISLSDNVPPEWKQNLYLIFKEAINNISKHSDASKVKLAIYKNKPGQLIILIKDNGTKKSNETQMKGQGLKNLEMRIKRLNGIAAVGQQQEGFEVRATFKR